VFTGLHSGAVTILENPQVPVTDKVKLVPSVTPVIIIFPVAVVDGLSPLIIPFVVLKLYDPVFPPEKGIVVVYVSIPEVTESHEVVSVNRLKAQGVVPNHVENTLIPSTVMF
jgi:hypothetical protein